MMDEYGKSDSPAVPGKSSYKVPRGAAEAMEERGLAKGNPNKGNAPRTQSRISRSSALEREREAAPWRHYLRQEPGAVVLHAGICEGGRWATSVPTATRVYV